MNDNSGDRRGPRRRLRPHRAGILVATAGIAVLAAACGGTSTAGAGTFIGGTYTQSLAYAKCMRSHGVPQFPAPDGQGNFNNSQIESITQNNPQARNAWAQCGSLLPNKGTGLSVTQLQDMQQQNLRNAVKAAHCMRAHGIEDFPDPAGSTQGSGINWQPVQSAIQSGRVDTNTPSYEAAYDACSGKRVGGPIPLTTRRGSWPRHPRRGPAAAPPGPGEAAPLRRGGHHHNPMMPVLASAVCGSRRVAAAPEAGKLT